MLLSDSDQREIRQMIKEALDERLAYVGRDVRKLQTDVAEIQKRLDKLKV